MAENNLVVCVVDILRGCFNSHHNIHQIYDGGCFMIHINRLEKDHERFVVVRLADGELWFWGSFDKKDMAEKAVKELSNAIAFDFGIVQEMIKDIELCGGMTGHIEKGEAIAIIKSYLQEVDNDG